MNRIEKIYADIDDKKIKTFRNNLDILQKYILLLKKQGINVNAKNVKEIIYTKIFDTHTFNFGFDEIARNKIYLFLMYTNQYILQNPQSIYGIFDNLTENDKKEIENCKGKIKITGNMQQNIKSLIIGAIDAYELKYEKKDCREFIFNVIYSNAKSDIENKENEDMVKKLYIIKLSNIISLLDEMGYLKLFNDLNNKRLEYIGLNEILGFEYKNKSNTDYKINYITDLANKKSLEKLTIQQLIVLISFYLNRLEKISCRYEEVFLLLQNKNLLGKMVNGEDIDSILKDNEIKEGISKFKYVSEIAGDLLKKFSSSEKEKSTIDSEEMEKRILDGIDKKTENEYAEFNNKCISGRSKIRKDISNINLYLCNRNNLYFNKENFMHLMLYSLLTEKNEINWGYVEEDKYGKSNSIKSNDRYILIKSDIRGFNNPVCLHCNLESIKKFLQTFNGSKILPIYEGEEDFRIKKDKEKVYMSNILLMPIHSSRIKKLNKFAQGMDSESIYYSYVKHINGINSKKFQNTSKRYIDLRDGKIIQDDLGRI